MSTATIVCGLGFGDEGKGLVTSYLTATQHAHWNIRYNGGAQAAHHVVKLNGTWHRFQQFGSGTFDFASTFLSRYMIVHPLRLLDEARELQDRHLLANPLREVFIDSRALVITPYHTALNQLKERSRGANRHGSTGLGIGEVRAFDKQHPDLALRAGDLAKPQQLSERMRAIGELLAQEAREYAGSAQFDERAFRTFLSDYQEAGRYLHVVRDDFFAEHVMRDGNLVFEGAQGILLDEVYGFHPHNTWTNTTTANARSLLAEAGYEGAIVSLGVMRPYMTRHGAGPLPTEDANLNSLVQDQHNTASEWTGGMRYGHLDRVLLRYALQVSGGVDEIALTHVDKVEQLPDLVAMDYENDHEVIDNVARLLTADEIGVREGQMRLTSRLEGFRPRYQARESPSNLAEVLGRPITVCSSGPTKREVWRVGAMTPAVHLAAAVPGERAGGDVLRDAVHQAREIRWGPRGVGRVVRLGGRGFRSRRNETSTVVQG